MGGGGGGYAARLFLLFSFPCSADHERDWPPCKVVFLFFRVGNQYAECEKQQQQQQQQRGRSARYAREFSFAKCHGEADSGMLHGSAVGNMPRTGCSSPTAEVCGKIPSFEIEGN